MKDNDQLAAQGQLRSGIVAVFPARSRQKMVKKSKKDITLREHLKTIQSDGGKARWANLTPEERSAQAKKIVAARWAKKALDAKASASSPGKKPVTRKAPAKG